MAIVTPPTLLAWFAGSTAFRAALGYLLPFAEPIIKKWACAAKVSASGEKLALLMDLKGEVVQSVASIHQHGRTLYLGNLMGAGMSYITLGEGE